MTDRSLDRLRDHWEIERELADQLRRANRDERTTLYGAVYDELFRRVPDHPQRVRKAEPARARVIVEAQTALIRGFLVPGGTYLEVGAGDCALALAITRIAARVYAVEVSRTISEMARMPKNFELLITDGREIPVAPGSVDLVYSNQLMEHLHPDDAREQLINIFTALRSGGRYVCMTPNRLLGPSDISQYFEEEVASGFHLREYSTRELRDEFRAAGFSGVKVVAVQGQTVRALAVAPFAGAEALFEALPRPLRLRLKSLRPLRKLLSPSGGLVATKR